MCVTYFAWMHPQLADLLFLCMFNRDEVLGRPTAPSHFWQDTPHILGGRDLVAGGTWMALSTNGRAAFLTNFREMRDTQRQGVPSRGALPVDFVSSEAAPEEYLAGLDAKAYPGFNLMAADFVRRSMAYLCSKDKDAQPQPVPPGLHALTNGHLDGHWPKLDEGCRQLQQLLDRGFFSCANGHSADASGGKGGSSGSGGATAVPWDELFQLLSDDRLLEEDPDKLPATGYGPKFEAAVSGIFVQPVDTQWGPFGTRSQTVVAVWHDGRGELRERYIAEDGSSWEEVRHCFKVPCQQAGADEAGRDLAEHSGLQ